MANILVLQGPNLNLLGTREPHLYGHETLSSLHERLTIRANTLGHSLIAFQSNSEEKLINRVHETATDQTDFILLNPAAFTHTSLALREALSSVLKPFIEIHLSNLQRRESFRHTSYFSDIALGTITGLGAHGYFLALDYVHHYFSELRSTVSHGHAQNS